MPRFPHDHTIPAELAHEQCPRCRWDDCAWNIGTVMFMVLMLLVWRLS